MRKNALSFAPPKPPKDFIHIDRWMCSNCGLVFDFDENHSPGEPGWIDTDPPDGKDVIEWVDDEGHHHIEQLGYKTICPRCGISLDEKPLVRIIVSPTTSINDVIPILQQGEGLRIDYKVNIPDTADKLGRNIAAFATSSGGRIFLGVNNEGNIKGYEGIDSQKGKEELQKLIRGIFSKVHPKVIYQIDFVPPDASRIAIITAPKGHFPVYYFKNVPYIRELEEARPATPDEVQQLISVWGKKRS